MMRKLYMWGVKGTHTHSKGKVSFEMNSSDTNILVDETYCAEALHFDNHALYGHPKAGQLWNNSFVNTII